QRHLMNRAVTEINYLFRMAEPEACVIGLALMTGVGTRRRITTRERFRHHGEPKGSRITAVANADKLAVPTASRHPDFNVDFRIVRRFDLSYHAAERREFIERRRTRQARRREVLGLKLQRADTDRLCQCDRRIR